jgi:hypothetical protein
MRSWIARQLHPVRGSVQPNRIILDPDLLLSDAEIAELNGLGEAATAADWLELRRIYEESGRYRPVDEVPLVLVVRSSEFRERRQLPYDIEQRADVVRVRLALADPLRSLVLDLQDEAQDVAIDAAVGSDPLGGVLQAVWGIRIGAEGGSDVAEVDAMVRLRTDPTVPGGLFLLLKDRLKDPLARGLAEEPPNMGPLQHAWSDWVATGSDSPSALLFERVGARIVSLFHGGMLLPVRSNRDLPGWASAGVEQPGWLSVAESMLATPPVDEAPAGVAEWVRLAEWWGEVRMALALGAPGTAELAAGSWEQWEQWDERFRSFLHDDLGKLLSSAAGRPQTVNRIAPFLARRLREGHTERIMLVVFDGMGFPHWSMVRRETGLTVADASGVLAMAPSLTPVSRQAIFAGALLLTFPGCLENTKKEGELWRRFWENEGVPVTAVGYKNIEGTQAIEVPHFPTEQVVGVVVRAIDELMHTSELLGEAQFGANVETWLKHGFVRELVERAAADGFEVWFTADHGSLEVVPLGRPMEGLAVDTAGTRVRLYATEALREQSKADGDLWDPPGMPTEGPYPLFPWGRFGLRHGVRVTHGGLSFDEMIVPFVRVEP